MNIRELLFKKNSSSCSHCGTTLWTHDRKITSNGKTFCGEECQEEYREDNPILIPSELPLEYNQQQLELGL